MFSPTMGLPLPYVLCPFPHRPLMQFTNQHSHLLFLWELSFLRNQSSFAIEKVNVSHPETLKRHSLSPTFLTVSLAPLGLSLGMQ